ncbi:phage integrase [Burkholderia pseudomallei]|uniref:phage integrase SAM-like domain-containing protein n=1 Tax=Burkholderia pseudomallei TaxID=28450 RepID=UPI000F08C5C0|nr:phage integrase SAM-like domain-containing protein [Burkholderia pseudomallei]CAK0387362.1 phage integrase [Burkholderia pseudomallei]VBD48507.1 phage integrase [Burkholderia pseudomallei]
MSKRKVFPRSDLAIPAVEHVIAADGVVTISPDAFPPAITRVYFAESTTQGARSYDFGKWYGVRIDEIVYACQRQIERFTDKQDAEVSPATVRTYADALNDFFKYTSMVAAARGESLALRHIDRSLIDGFLGFLRDTGTATSSQKSCYHAVKAVLKALCRRQLIREELAGDKRTFPSNPFPGVHRTTKGEKPLSLREKREVARVLRAAITPLFDEGAVPTSQLLAVAFLLVALHTGRNTTPLLEMTLDSLRPHPKDGTMFLVLYKRRGHSTSKVALKNDRTDTLDIESVGAVKTTVTGIIRRVIHITSHTRSQAPEGLRQMVWIYPLTRAAFGFGSTGDVTALSPSTLYNAITDLVSANGLIDASGKPLRLNVSRLRKTFVNRMFELLDGDLVATAAAAGNSPSVVDRSYLEPGEESSKNWQFMGMTLVNELLTGTLGATERTPVARCSNTSHGEYAQKQDQSVCMNFLNCLRCRNLVVTGDDLYRLFSFYWRILKERTRMDVKRWRRQLAHIVRLIEQDVIEQGLRRKVFTQTMVDHERERARIDPHPFWKADTIISDLAGAEA